MDFLPPPLLALEKYKQFIAYKIIPGAKKNIKKPIDYHTGNVCNPHDNEIWSDFSTISQAVKKLGDNHGVGFVLTETDPFFLIDIDSCLVNGDWSSLAKSILANFHGAAVEISSSLIGLHIIGSSSKFPDHACKNKDFTGLELYSSLRFIALTGLNAIGDAHSDCTRPLHDLINQCFQPINNYSKNSTLSNEPRHDWKGPKSDEDLINRALKSTSARATFAGHASFFDLWTANTEVLGRVYPDPERLYDANAADAALAKHLAFWTGCNGERMLRLMPQSALNREKWERPDYLPRTILFACNTQDSVCKDKPVEPLHNYAKELNKKSKIKPEPVVVMGKTLLGIEDQLDFFSGCVYITDSHCVLTPKGAVLKPEQFRVVYGGYVFLLDARNEKTTTDAWKCFTESQAFRRAVVDTACFRPDLEPGEIVTSDGEIAVNQWMPVNVKRTPGDASPILNHIKLMIPDAEDRLKLISYLAACVQHQGVKFAWCPLIQGTEGNGKTLITMCVSEAIGYKYVYFPRATEIDSKFNEWMYGRTFIGVDDIYTPESKYQMIEILKPMIDRDRREIEPKGRAQSTKRVCCNFLLNSNHKDAIRKTKNDRRIANFYTAQQSVDDLMRDGMLYDDYFPKLTRWLKSEGYAIFSEFLHTFEIPDEYNPAKLCIRAPITTSTDAAIRLSLNRVEQEIMEAIDQGQAGFRGGWISSIMLDKLLEKIGAARRVPPTHRRDILFSLGYDYHPGLKDGRTNVPVIPDGGKPRLYLQFGHAHWHIKTPVDICRQYVLDQALE